LNYISFSNEFYVTEELLEFREQKVFYDQGDQAFHVTFNNTVDPEKLEASSFKFKIGEKRLRSVDVQLIENSELTVRVQVLNWDNTPVTLYEEDMEKISYELKDVYDVSGREIYEQEVITGDQYREFFVQQVNRGKVLPENLRFMPQHIPMVAAPVNSGFPTKDFVINSPLQQKKYRDESNYTFFGSSTVFTAEHAASGSKQGVYPKACRFRNRRSGFLCHSAVFFLL
jgi:hypothetical protein